MGDQELDQNAPKSKSVPDDLNSEQNLGSIKNNVYTAGFSLVFQDGSPYLKFYNIQKYEDKSPTPMILYFEA